MLDRLGNGPAPAAALVGGANALPIYSFAGLLALSVIPVLMTPIPAMLDYPNHLARMFLLSRGDADAHPHYQLAWAFYPNLAMDLVVPRLARFMSVEGAMRLFLLLAQLLVVSGSVAVEWAVKRRFELAGFVALLFLYSMPFAWGFVNFQFGLGLALWGIAAWLVLARHSLAVRFAVHSLIVFALFTAHFFALGIYGFTLGVIELWAVWSRRAGVGEHLRTFAVLALPATVVLGIMAGLGGSVGGEGTDWLPAYKPRWLFSVLSGDNLPLSFIGMTLVIGLVYLLARHGMVQLQQPGPWLATGFALLYVAMPFRLFDSAFVDVRVVVAAAFILPAFTTLSLRRLRWRRGLAAVVIGLTLANLASVTWVWTSYRTEYAAMIASFGLLERGSRVLIGHTSESPELSQTPMYHAPTLAAHFADAFVPTLYTSPGMQPLSPRPAVLPLYIGWGGPVPISALKLIVEDGSVEEAVRARAPQSIRNWEQDFQYLYVLGPPAANPLPGLLTRIDTGSQFVLYRIGRPGT